MSKPGQYIVREHDDAVRIAVINYLDKAHPGFRERFLPYSVWGPAGCFAFGQLIALCPDKKTAEEIASAMTLLDRTRE